MKRFYKLVLLLILFSQVSWAQSRSTFKRTAATIVFTSISGGILGLSTLSFYGRPQEHTDNITTGVGIGFVTGIAYIIYQNYGQSQGFDPLSKKSPWIYDDLDFKIQKPAPPQWTLFQFESRW